MHTNFIYEITKVKFFLSLHKYHDVTLAATDDAAYVPYLGPNRKRLFDSYSTKIFTY